MNSIKFLDTNFFFQMCTKYCCAFLPLSEINHSICETLVYHDWRWNVLIRISVTESCDVILIWSYDVVLMSSKTGDSLIRRWAPDTTGGRILSCWWLHWSRRDLSLWPQHYRSWRISLQGHLHKSIVVWVPVYCCSSVFQAITPNWYMRLHRTPSTLHCRSASQQSMQHPQPSQHSLTYKIPARKLRAVTSLHFL